MPNPVSSGTDGLGLFGATNGDLSGKAFAVQFVYDPSLGLLSDNSPVSVSRIGGDAHSAPTPILSAYLTINSETTFSTVTNPFDTSVSTQNPAEQTNPQFTIDYAGGDGNHGIFFTINEATISTALPFSLTTPFDVTATASSGLNFKISDEFAITQGNFDTSELVVSEIGGPSGAPEPFVWTMLFVGFFGVETVVRHRAAAVIVTG